MIRRGRPGDGDEVAALFRRSFGTLTFLPTLHTPEEDRAFFGKAIEDGKVWVAEEDGRLVGFAALSEEMLEHLYVEPREHGRGVGSALLDRAKAARPDGFRFWVFQRNERARRVFQGPRWRPGGAARRAGDRGGGAGGRPP